MKKDSIKEIVSYVLFGLLGVLIVFILMLSAFPNLALSTFGTRAYIVKYDTMEPTLKPYDLVFINRVKVDELEENDLITFYTDVNYDGDQEMVTYYIYSVTDVNGTPVFRVNAEGSSTPANAILTEDTIIGGYSFRIPFLGRIIEFIASPFGIAAIVVNAAVITVIVIILKDPKKKETKQKESKQSE
ncbi:MAG: hypothetical protein WCR19_05480 [Acholeplasmataceae bacterium]